MKTITKKLKDKKCKVCSVLFTPLRPLQACCTWECANIYAKELNEKKEKKDWQKRKAKMKSDLMTKSDWLKIAQSHVNRYIRLRDEGELCISCQKPIYGVKHASHYLSSGGHSNVRFHEDNIFVSCYKCNVMLSGNQVEYRKALIKKIGIERVEWLENNGSKVKNWSLEEIKEIIEIYKLKCKELKDKR